MMRGSRNLLWLLPLLLLAAAPAWWPMVVGFLQPRGDFILTQSSNGKERIFSMEDVFFTQSKNGEIDLEVKAKQILTSKGESEVQLKHVLAVVHDENGQPIEITGGIAQYDTKEQILRVRDNVEISSPEGYRLQTEALQYSAIPGTIENDNPVIIQSKSLKASGTGFRLNVATGDFLLNGRIAVTTH